MTELNQESVIFQALDDLLDRERAALVRGDLQTITDLIAEKESLMHRIGGIDATDRDGLQHLQGKAIRNQALLDSALRGIRTVANRFATLRRIRKSLETYDEFGHKSSLPAGHDNKVEKRA